jgi:hypothetical protein
MFSSYKIHKINIYFVIFFLLLQSNFVVGDTQDNNLQINSTNPVYFDGLLDFNNESRYVANLVEFDDKVVYPSELLNEKELTGVRIFLNVTQGFGNYSTIFSFNENMTVQDTIDSYKGNDGYYKPEYLNSCTHDASETLWAYSKENSQKIIDHNPWITENEHHSVNRTQRIFDFYMADSLYERCKDIVNPFNMIYVVYLDQGEEGQIHLKITGEKVEPVGGITDGMDITSNLLILNTKSILLSLSILVVYSTIRYSKRKIS